MNKNDIKNNILILGVLLLGTFSVSIANLFKGYYCAVAALVVLFVTMYLFDTLDKNKLEENKPNLIMIGGVAFFELIFFIINDIVGDPVYVSGNVGFLGGMVIFSQLFSVVSAIYYVLKKSLFNSRKPTIEVIEAPKEKEEKVQEEIEPEEVEVEEEYVEEIKRLPNGTLGKDAPFMEEEK